MLKFCHKTFPGIVYLVYGWEKPAKWKCGLNSFPVLLKLFACSVYDNQ